MHGPRPFVARLIVVVFDMDRMIAVLETTLGQNRALDDVTRAVFDAVEEFSGRHEDDWTLLLAKRT